MFLGDVVGRAGRDVVLERLPGLVERYALDFVVVNGENAAGGFGITEEICQSFLDAGADAVTLGNHAWDQREALVFIERQERLVRPVNYPAGTPGRGALLVTARNGGRVLVVNVMGRLFMEALDDPYQRVEESIAGLELGRGADAIVLDVHAEATSEKQSFGYLFDGRVSLVAGTHTHVPTADHRILPGGTAYLTDVGMCGAYDSVIGMEKDEPLARMVRRIPSARFSAAKGPATLCGVCVETDDATGLARAVAPIRIDGDLETALPSFWS